MGWFWQSNSAASQAAAATPSTIERPPPPLASTPPAAPSPSDNADREIQKFWEMLQEEASAKPDPKPSVPASRQRQQQQPTGSTSTLSSWLPWSSSLPAATPVPVASTPAIPPRERSDASLALSDETYPTTLSCRDAFDYAWKCHTAGSQLNSVYRYGGARSCSELWDDFWFCMRTRSHGPEAKAEAIREFYRAKEATKYGADRPSSEDVWESRDHKIEKGSAFNERFDLPTVDDAQLQREEMARRRETRQSYGFGDAKDQD